MAYGAAVQVLRVAVNVGGSTGSAGLDTNLAPTMTIGTGFFGRSSLGENLEPRHLINLTRMAYAKRPGRAVRRLRRSGAVERDARRPSRWRQTRVHGRRRPPTPASEIRRVVLEELRELVKR